MGRSARIASALFALALPACVADDGGGTAVPRGNAIAELPAVAPENPDTDPDQARIADPGPAPERRTAALHLTHEHEVSVTDEVLRRLDRGDVPPDASPALLHQLALAALVTDETLEGSARFERGLALYARLIRHREFERYAHADEALFDTAEVLRQAGKLSEMKKSMLRLIREFPTSRFVPYAFLSFADYYADAGDCGPALKLYGKSRQFQDAYVHAYASYRMGWCAYSGTPSNPRDSLQYFVEAVAAAQDSKASWARRIRDESLRALVLPYAQAAMASKARAFLAKVADGSGVSVDELLARLASAYQGNGNAREAEFVCGQLGSAEFECPWR